MSSNSTTAIPTRVALITGASQGIGRAVALRLASDGLDVAVNDIASKKDALTAVVAEIEGIGRKGIAIPGDVSEENEVKQMVESTVERLGRLDVMVANAGLGRAGADGYVILDANIANWEALFAVNIRGVILCYKYAAIQMVKQGQGGRIIGACSICGLRGYANVGAYCISKAAVRSLTQTASLELGPHNITVNAYAPGVIESPMTSNADDAKAGDPTATVRKILRISDAAKTGQPEDVANIVSFLASPASHFVTGQIMGVSGGQEFV